MNSMTRLRFPYTEVVNTFTSQHSDGWIKSAIRIGEEDVACALYDDDRRCMAVGFLRGWEPRWEHKCLGLIVHQDARGRGYGSLMLRFLETIARDKGETKLRLHVDPQNHKARKLYEKNYWYPYGRRENGELIYYKMLHNSRSRV